MLKLNPISGNYSIKPSAREGRTKKVSAALGHLRAVAGDLPNAEALAAEAVAHGTGTRLGSLSHARFIALGNADHLPNEANQPAANTLRDFAWQLATTRPALERTLIDLRLRQGLTDPALGRVLGISSEQSNDIADEAEKNWEQQLDPLILAWLGPGSCDQLASVLKSRNLWPRKDTAHQASIDATGPIEIISVDTISESDAHQLLVSDYLQAQDELKNHIDSCEICATRLRGVNGVAETLAAIPLPEASREFVDAAKLSSGRLTKPLPPSIHPRRFDFSRFFTPGLITFTALALLAIVLVGENAWMSNREEKKNRVDDIVKSAPNAKLLATPSVIRTSKESIQLVNTSEESILWNATTSASWLTTEPDSGRLQPNKSVDIKLKTLAPSNETSETVISIEGSDGSLQTVRLRP